MTIIVPDDSQFAKVVKNLEKLYDVHEVAVAAAGAPTPFSGLARNLIAWPVGSAICPLKNPPSFL